MEHYIQKLAPASGGAREARCDPPGDLPPKFPPMGSRTSRFLILPSSTPLKVARSRKNFRAAAENEVAAPGGRRFVRL
jgi:hypothetical protein